MLRSYDQFGNIVLNDCYERYYLDLEYAEEYRGVYLMRGENIVLVGELVPYIYSVYSFLILHVGPGRVSDGGQEDGQISQINGDAVAKVSGAIARDCGDTGGLGSQ